MIDQEKNNNTPPRVAIIDYVEYFLREYKELSRLELTILISKHAKSEISLKKSPENISATISTALTNLKKEGKIINKDERWEWVE